MSAALLYDGLSQRAQTAPERCFYYTGPGGKWQPFLHRAGRRMNFSRREKSGGARTGFGREKLEILQEKTGKPGKKLEECRLDRADYPNCYVERFSTGCGKLGGYGGKNRLKNGFPHFQQGFQQRLGKLWNYSPYNRRSSAAVPTHPAQNLHF